MIRKLLALVLIGLLAGCSVAQQQAVQADIVQFQTDLQSQRDRLIPLLQAGIVYSQSVGDVEWTNCQQGVLDLIQGPLPQIPDISNPFINVEVLHQIGQGINSGVQNNPIVKQVNLACAPWYMREKADILQLVVRLGAVARP